MRLGAICVQAGKKLTYDKDQISQVFGAVGANIQGSFVNFLHEHLVDGIIKQGVFILKVCVKRGAVDLCLVGYILNGDVPSPLDPPSGCAFHPRCPFRFAPCDRAEPPLEKRGPGRFVACHLSAGTDVD